MSAYPSLGRGIPAGIEKAVETRIHEASFGDGYTQRAAAGLNNIREKWTIEYRWLTTTDHNTLMATIQTAGGYGVISWTPPDSSTAKNYIIRGWNVIAEAAGFWTVRIELSQVFDL